MINSMCGMSRAQEALNEAQNAINEAQLATKSQMGAYDSMKSQVLDLTRKLQEADQNAMILAKDHLMSRAEADGEITILKNQITAFKSRMDDYETIIAEKDAVIAQCVAEKEVDSLKIKIAEYEAEISAKDELLKRTVASHKVQMLSLELQLAQMNV